MACAAIAAADAAWAGRVLTPTGFPSAELATPYLGDGKARQVETCQQMEKVSLDGQVGAIVCAN